MRATYHTTLQATPAQLVFGRDAILNVQFDANWALIQQRKKQIIHKNNQPENSKRIAHQYKVRDKVLLRREDKAKYQHDAYDGPYTIVQVNNNGTVHLCMGKVVDTINICRIKPYQE